MKKNKINSTTFSKVLFLFTITITLFFNSFAFNKIKISSEKKIEEIEEKKSLDFQKTKNLWGKLFTGKRENCKHEKMKKKIILNLKARVEPKYKFKIKKWGFGPAAYFFDFLDNVIRKEIVTEFAMTFNKINSIKAKQSLKEIKEEKNKIQELGKNFDCKVFKNSVTYSQLKIAFKIFKWRKSVAYKDYIRHFINTYDTNKDGRLNPRELIIGIIDNNKNLIGKKLCKLCFENVLHKLDAIFRYIDCGNNEYINSEQIWFTLKKLQRPNKTCNIYHKGKYKKFRSTSVNDFVLKSHKGMSGVLNLQQWRIGLLLGIWDRQTSYKKITCDDSLNLKEVRWGKSLNIDIYLNKKNRKKALTLRNSHNKNKICIKKRKIIFIKK